MTRFLQPLWLLTTSSDTKLRQTVEYLREENRILCSRLPKQIPNTDRERTRLLKLGAALGGAIRELVTIVSYRTFCRWRAEPVRIKRKPFARKPGRPRTAEETRSLILRLARENGWGSTRVLGELKKLRARNVNAYAERWVQTFKNRVPRPLPLRACEFADPAQTERRKTPCMSAHCRGRGFSHRSSLGKESGG